MLHRISLFPLVAGLLLSLPAHAGAKIGALSILGQPKDASSQPFLTDLLKDYPGNPVKVVYADDTLKPPMLARRLALPPENPMHIDALLVHSHFVEAMLWQALQQPAPQPQLRIADTFESFQLAGVGSLQLDVMHGPNPGGADLIQLPWLMGNTVAVLARDLPASATAPGLNPKAFFNVLVKEGYFMIENQLPAEGTLAGIVERIKGIAPGLVIEKRNKAGMAAVQEVADEPGKAFTLFGLHPYVRDGGVEGIRAYHLRGGLMQSPVVAVVRRDLNAAAKAEVGRVLQYLATPEVQAAAAAFRFEGYPIPAWNLSVQ
jgi:hypothetical protein